MNITDWNAIADAYFQVDDPLERPVLSFVRDKLTTLQPKRLFDYGGGDGKFAILCAESLSTPEIVTFDPAQRMTSLARSLCADFKQIKVTDTTQDIQSGTFDVVTFNGVWMCLTSHAACLETLSEIARLLRSDGRLIASVTHPCFRSCKFSDYSTDFDRGDYFNNGTLFNVTIRNDKGDLHLVDTHWNLTAMSSQLGESGFLVENLYEMPRSTNGSNEDDASLWMVVVARKL
jgi:SAM-dependent methyltransferase